MNTILVVDDAPLNVLLVSRLLGADYRIITAGGGAEALEKYAAEKPDLVLLDMVMPEMDGIEVCRRIKAQERGNFAPVIFLTAQDDAQSKREGMLAGAEDFISKPVEPAELMARVHAALRTKSLYEQLRQANAVVERERDTIAHIQRGMLPGAPPDTPGLRFYCDYQPSSKAGGDYYDFLRIDAGHLGVIVCDVAGHGMPAAVIMAMTRIVLRSHLARVCSPREALARLNEILCENIEISSFITAFYGVIHLPSRTMRYSLAGHPPPLLIHYPEGGHKELGLSKGFPLKISRLNVLEEGETALSGGDKVIFYTDGITDAMNGQKEVFGGKRLLQTARELGRGKNCAELGRGIIKAIHEFQGAPHFADDYTLIVMDVE